MILGVIVKRPRVMLASALALASALTLGCGGGEAAGPSTPPLPAASGFTGRWDGTTGQNLPVRLYVNSTSVIDTLTVRLSAALGSVTCTGTVTRTGVPLASDGSFSASIGIGFTTTLRGRLTSTGSASGSIDAYAGAYGVLCGSTGAVGSGDALPALQWQAQRQ